MRPGTQRTVSVNVFLVPLSWKHADDADLVLSRHKVLLELKKTVFKWIQCFAGDLSEDSRQGSEESE